MKKLPVVAGIVLILFAGIAFFTAFQGVQQQQGVIVAKSNLPAYSTIQASQVEVKQVPKASITEYDLTQQEYEDNYVKQNKPLITTARFLAGQRIDKRLVVESGQGSFAMVASDERVVAVNATASGAAIGTINSGDVVDVSADGTGGIAGGGSATFAKVLCVATSPKGCKGVLPGGVNPAFTKTSQQDTRAANGATITLLLAVASADAPAIAGQTVSLSLNTSCKVNEKGQFVTVRSGSDQSLCQPAGRESSILESQKDDKEEGSDGSTGVTGAVSE